MTSCVGKDHARYYYVSSYQGSAVSCVLVLQIARNRETLRFLWVACIYRKDTQSLHIPGPIPGFAQSHSSDNENIVQDKAAALVSRTVCCAPDSVFSYLCCLFPDSASTASPSLPFAFSLWLMLLPQAFCVLSFLRVGLSLLFYMWTIFQDTHTKKLTRVGSNWKGGG